SNGLHRNGHDLSVRRFKEQLLAVAAPARHLAARERNGPLALARRKRAHVDCARSRLVRGERHPVAVWRELAKELAGLGPQEGNRLAARRCVFGRENPKISLGFRVTLAIDDEPAVPRPLSGENGTVIRQKWLILPATAGGF